MSSTSLEVVFEGPAVKSGTIDARLLAESLIGYSEVFTRANAILNGEASQAAVLVQSDFKQGSFVAGIELVQSVGQLITGHPFYDATALAGIIGLACKKFDKIVSVIDLVRQLLGEKPKGVKEVSGNNVEITFGENNKTVVVNKNVFNIFADRAAVEGLQRLTSPLRQAEIDRITVKQEGTEQVVFEKDEARSFEVEPLRLESEEALLQGERDAVLVVSKLSFTEGLAWSFIERGATVVAKIEDQGFWDKVHHHTITFGEGDRLRVTLRWATVRKHGKLTPKNIIVRVHEVLEHPKQMRLDGRKDDGPVVSPAPKGRKFRG